MSGVNKKDSSRPTFKKLSSLHADSNWEVWNFHMKSLLNGKNLAHLITRKAKRGYNLGDNKNPVKVLNNNKTIAASYINGRIDEDNQVPCNAQDKDSTRHTTDAFASELDTLDAASKKSLDDSTQAK
ncbi:hypothetical protein CROQUDRAFT_87553 [Cronartium quercuum f. sp. fusiforme G11]|uniref:Uncharacterized protein n=1 Tax=Cronartium quercuum f. sp. fusiforme G11 TaxID=708437 RepID=A0A9P6NWJ2_9BASI|nr:hypothetical protein CROQUDRAFT_87553 [Cronartium quercuum f. sp. fusiforme G11]